MKEIDLIPEWYRSGKRRQNGYRRQYVVFACVVATIVVWNFSTGRSLSEARAQLGGDSPGNTMAGSTLQELAGIRGQVTELQKKARLIEAVDSRIDVPGTIGEISFLVGEKIVLSEVSFSSEKFSDSQPFRPGAGSAVRIAGTSKSKGTQLPGDVRFKVTIRGVAADASDVAFLVCGLEESVYLCDVTSSWRNGKITVEKDHTKENLAVTEFEISGYLANYRQEGAGQEKTTAR